MSLRLGAEIGQYARMWFALGMIITLAWPAPGAHDDAVEALRTDDSIQRELPVASTEAKAKPSKREPTQSDDGIRISSANSSVASFLLWVILGVVVLALIVVIARETMQRPAEARAPPADAPDAEPLAPLQVAAGTLNDAERLAQQGHFAQAIHTLLLRTFETIGRQAALPHALTSREILRRVRAEKEAMQALAHLVNSVEICIFGTAEPGAEEYQLCRASFEHLLGARGIEVT